MIHNNAVVNEDTTASVAILQAEVKRLKQELMRSQGTLFSLRNDKMTRFYWKYCEIVFGNSMVTL
jgi:hypothetical protein